MGGVKEILMGVCFLPTYTIGPKTWYQDDLGPYWIADLLCNGKKMGVTGNFYDRDLDQDSENLGD
jgi:hypothetical protein